MIPLNELASIVSKFSPAVATALGSPAGGIVAAILAKVFNSSSFDMKDLIEKLKADPEAEFKIKQLEQSHAEVLAEVNDLASARNREMNFTNATKQRDWMLPLLSVVVAVGFFVTTWVVIFLDVDQDEKYFLYGLIFGIGIQFAQVYNYYFGKNSTELVQSLFSPLIKVYNSLFKHKP